jgi:hypothetical protein
VEPLAPLLSIIASDPGSVVGTFGMLVAFSLLVLRFRNTSLDSVTSVSKLHAEQVESLLKQNRALADDLDALRKRMSAALDEIGALRDEVGFLKSRLSMYDKYCGDCPKRPPA